MRLLISLGFVCALFFSVPYGGTSCSALSSEGVQEVSESAQSVSADWVMRFEVVAFEGVQWGVEMRKEFGHQADGIGLERRGLFITLSDTCQPIVLLSEGNAYRSHAIAWTGYGEVHQFFMA